MCWYAISVQEARLKPRSRLAIRLCNAMSIGVFLRAVPKLIMKSRLVGSFSPVK
jgi:hypothetical protein